MPSRPAHAAVQTRSQKTRDRLLDAAESVLREHGLEGATVPAIAGRAGVAVGSLYRRYPDKDAVLRAVFERYSDRNRASNAATLSSDHWKGLDAYRIVTNLVASLVESYFGQKRLLAALVQYTEAHPDAKFRRQAEASRHEAFRAIQKLLLERKRDIGHPDPERAIEFSLMLTGAALKEFVLRERYSIDADQLTRELIDVVTRYLKIRR
jgi:AcrR family transcriptional regulator